MFGRRPTTPLEERLGHRFRDPALLERAVTHRSYAYEHGAAEHGGGDHSERLEFLGDAVLGAAASEWLYRRYPDLPEGELSQLKGWLVSRPVLARHARRLGLGELLRLGVGEERSGGRGKDSLLADALEAVLGAVFLDGGFAAARSAVEALLLEAAAERAGDPLRADAKTRLQELTQARGWGLPAYRLVSEAGPEHEKTFAVECRLETGTAAAASGPSKKIAEQRAAAAVMAAVEAAAAGLPKPL
jgi:ribonuclease-3